MSRVVFFKVFSFLLKFFRVKNNVCMNSNGLGQVCEMHKVA